MRRLSSRATGGSSVPVFLYADAPGRVEKPLLLVLSFSVLNAVSARWNRMMALSNALNAGAAGECKTASTISASQLCDHQRAFSITQKCDSPKKRIGVFSSH